MSVNRDRAALNKAKTGREYKIIWYNILYPIYWEEGSSFHPVYRRGYKNPNKFLQMYEVRKYRSWKYNRKTQWRQ